MSGATITCVDKAGLVTGATNSAALALGHPSKEVPLRVPIRMAKAGGDGGACSCCVPGTSMNAVISRACAKCSVHPSMSV